MTRHLALVGATATGKSTLALALAQTMPAVEIVSLDSMQVYREMDIGTAKPTIAERASVPHHLVDVADPSEEWSLRRTQDAAAAAIRAVEARDGRAILVGGTGLYVRAVVDELHVPARDVRVRDVLEAATATTDGLATAYARLRLLDPVAATRIEPGNRRRIIRALEVYETTGRAFSSFGPGLTAYPPPAIDVALVGLAMSRTELSARITARFDGMRAAGLVDEVRSLASRRPELSRTARQAIGYKEVLAFLAGEVASADDAFDLAVRRTRKLARRQDVWFRRDPRITWVEASGNQDRVTAEILARWCPA